MVSSLSANRGKVRSRRCLFFLCLIVLGTMLNGCGAGSHEATFVARRRIQEDDAFESGAYRVKLSPFHLVLSKTSGELDDPTLDDMFGIVESVIEAYVREELRDSQEKLQYIYLRDMEALFLNEQTTLTFIQGGIAQFSGPGTIDSFTIDGWAESAVEIVLPSVLRDGASTNPLVQQIDVALYLADGGGGGTPTGIATGPEGSGGKRNMLPLVLSVIALVTLVTLLAAYFVSQRISSQKVVDVNNEPDMFVRNGVPGVSLAHPPELERTPSVGERSESSFTVSTEAGDSTLLKTVNMAGHTEDVSGMVEPFEHDRMRINVRKDMLASTWVGEKSVANANLPPQMDSVLAPSHFVATKEEEDKRLRSYQQAQAEAWDLEEEEDAALRFESADGYDEDDTDEYMDPGVHA